MQQVSSNLEETQTTHCNYSLMTVLAQRGDSSVELCPAGESAPRPLLRIRGKAMAQGGEPGVVEVYLDGVRHLVAALVDAATQLAESQ